MSLESKFNWELWYEKIINDFNFSKEDDIKSAKVLNEIIYEIGKFNINQIHVKDTCIIFGAGPSINRNIDEIKKYLIIENYTIIAADGATSALLEENIIPDIIVTDLDGDINSIINANKKGSILYVHAHGDNINKIKKYTKKLRNIIPTCQNNKFGLLENYGGFTDGDRAIYIAFYGLNIKNIILAGMDYGTLVTWYSRPDNLKKIEQATDFKIKKLEYAKILTELIKKDNHNLNMYNISNSHLKNIPNINLKTVKNNNFN